MTCISLYAGKRRTLDINLGHERYVPNKPWRASINVSGRAFRAYRSSAKTATDVNAIDGVKSFLATNVKCYGSASCSNDNYIAHQERDDSDQNWGQTPETVKADFDHIVPGLPVQLVLPDRIDSLFE